MKEVSLDLPPRGEFEEDATDEQLDYLERLVEIESAELRKLGKWQASWLIDRIKAEQEKPAKRHANLIVGGGVGLIIGIILWWIF